jgi:hypothetical protein
MILNIRRDARIGHTTSKLGTLTVSARSTAYAPPTVSSRATLAQNEMGMKQMPTSMAPAPNNAVVRIVAWTGSKKTVGELPITTHRLATQRRTKNVLLNFAGRK